MSLSVDDLKKQPVTIRDTAASQSVLLRSVLPLTEEIKSGNSALLQGVEMTWFREPLFNVYLDSD